MRLLAWSPATLPQPTRLSVYEGLDGLVMPRLTRTMSLPKLVPARPHGFSAVLAATTEPAQPAHKGSMPAGAARGCAAILPRPRQVPYAARTESVLHVAQARQWWRDKAPAAAGAGAGALGAAGTCGLGAALAGASALAPGAGAPVLGTGTLAACRG